MTLTPTAAVAFPDLATRDGVVLRIEAGWVVIKWRGIAGETRLPAADVEKVLDEEAR